MNISPKLKLKKELI